MWCIALISGELNVFVNSSDSDRFVSHVCEIFLQAFLGLIHNTFRL